MADIEAPPLPYETMAALRSIGYKFPQALADVVDNSIDAGSSEIKLEVMAHPESAADSYVLLMDDGVGMTHDQLVKAMQLGGSNSSAESLGKFGMGMKTASLSQCERMLVGSLKDGDFYGYAWDMEVLKRKGKWLLESVSRSDFPPKAREHLKSIASGTIVMWTRLRAYKDKSAGVAARSLDAAVLDAQGYLSTVFHRFLSGEIEGKKVTIKLNGDYVLPAWDPYCCSEMARKTLDQVTLKVENMNGFAGSITFDPVVLPSQDGFSSARAFTLAGGYNKWNDMQGFYFYRNNRLISFGGWDRLRAKDEKVKFLRVAIDYTVNKKMDDELAIDVSKESASIPGSLRQKIDKYLTQWIKVARDNYSKDRDEPDRKKEKKFSLIEVERMLLREAEGDEKITIKKLFRKL